MRRFATLVVVLAALLLGSGCMQKGYEEGKEKRQDKADKMIQDNSE